MSLLKRSLSSVGGSNLTETLSNSKLPSIVTSNGFRTVYPTGKWPFDHKLFFAAISLLSNWLLTFLGEVPGEGETVDTRGSYLATYL